MSCNIRRCASTLLKTAYTWNFLQVTKRRICNVIVTTQEQVDSRFQTENTHNIHSRSKSNWITSIDESREMMAIWPDIVRDITYVDLNLDAPDLTKWITKLLQYNVPKGKKNRAFQLLHAYKKLVSPEQLTKDNLRLARILGWCVELNQAFWLVLDDVIDRSQTRRGQPCWYLNNDIGLKACNDSVLLEHTVYRLLELHFSRHSPCYIDLLEAFLQSTMKTAMGQTLDGLVITFEKKPDLNLFTMDRYNAIVKYKTGYYSFVLPVQLAMYFAGVKDPELHRQAETILLEMGHFFQMQDDYLDCFGDPQITGKLPSDIQEGKCSWPIVVALQRASPAQRCILEECYGSDDPKKVASVKELYIDLGLQTMYSICEEENYNLINTHIQQISRGLPHDIFFEYLQKIYRREK